MGFAIRVYVGRGTAFEERSGRVAYPQTYLGFQGTVLTLASQGQGSGCCPGLLRAGFWPSGDEEQGSSCHFCHPSLPHASCCSQAPALRSHNALIVHQPCQAAPREQLGTKGLGRKAQPTDLHGTWRIIGSGRKA